MTDPMELWKDWVPRATYDEQEARANQAEAIARVHKGANERLGAQAETAESIIERVREWAEIRTRSAIASDVLKEEMQELLSLLDNPKGSERGTQDD